MAEEKKEKEKKPTTKRAPAKKIKSLAADPAKKTENGKTKSNSKAKSNSKVTKNKTTVAAVAKKNGRPEKIINQRQFEKLCAIQCTQAEICSILECSEKTLTRWCKKTYKKSFSQIFEEKRLGGRASLRRKQWEMADKNATMAIWLGKQYLGQKDHWDEDDSREVLEKLDNVLQRMDGVV